MITNTQISQILFWSISSATILSMLNTIVANYNNKADKSVTILIMGLPVIFLALLTGLFITIMQQLP